MKKLISVLLILALFCSCGDEIKNPEEENISSGDAILSEEDPAPDFEQNPGENGTLPEGGESSAERPEYDDFYSALVERKEEILPMVQDAVAEYIELGEEELWERFYIRPEEIQKVNSTDDFTVRKVYEGISENMYYAAVAVGNNAEIRISITETPKNELKIWSTGESTVAKLFAEEEYYNWELSDIPVPKSYPTVLQIGTWKTEHVDWFGQSGPNEGKNLSFEHLECRNWKNPDEYIKASFAVPHAAMPDIERAFGQINFSAPERMIIDSSVILWDGNFPSDFWANTIESTIKIGEFRRFGSWEEVKKGAPEGKTPSEEISLDAVKETEKYIRTFGDIYDSGKVELVEYCVDLGGGYGVNVYFYISESLTAEDIAIYDNIVESMIFEDMR
ncbi:MAG: hypothetical protein IJ300_12010 [Clostridia bacterium]|nr:hypothetical protein [Clostridia bacterium]